jgi:hypothetical protein
MSQGTSWETGGSQAGTVRTSAATLLLTSPETEERRAHLEADNVGTGARTLRAGASPQTWQGQHSGVGSLDRGSGPAHLARNQMRNGQTQGTQGRAEARDPMGDLTMCLRCPGQSSSVFP